MKITIITVCYNAVNTIEDTLLSVQNQNYSEIEHIVVDGASTDGTLDILKKHANTIDLLISEKDNGIYDAMNKGLQKASGEVVGFLNADDIFASSFSVSTIAKTFAHAKVDAVYGDLIYFSPEKGMDKIIRYFKSSTFKTGCFAKGWCPPHPTFYVKRAVYERFGNFDLQLKMGNDVELMMRFLEKERITTHYISEILVKMRIGGVSNQSFKNVWLQNKNILSAAKKLDIPIAVIPFIVYKVVNRLGQFFIKPSSVS